MESAPAGGQLPDAAWLRSGWHRPVSTIIVELTFEGVRSGRTYSFPDSYAEDPEGLVTFTRFSWWKNFREERQKLSSSSDQYPENSRKAHAENMLVCWNFAKSENLRKYGARL